MDAKTRPYQYPATIKTSKRRLQIIIQMRLWSMDHKSFDLDQNFRAALWIISWTEGITKSRSEIMVSWILKTNEMKCLQLRPHIH